MTPTVISTITVKDIKSFSDELNIGEDQLQLALQRLDQLIGLPQMKAQVNKMIASARRQLEQIQSGGSFSPLTWHMFFSGNPGTGKTTVARLMGEMLYAMKLLPSSHVSEITATQLIQGNSDEISEIIHHALNGILFIDEAYILAQNSGGKNILLQLMTAMEDHRANLVIILAGYPDSFQKIIQLNPGLNSRIPIQNHISFENYTPAELLLILTNMLNKHHIVLEEEAIPFVTKFFERESLKEQFGNAREVRNFADKVRMECAQLNIQSIDENLAKRLTGIQRETKDDNALQKTLADLERLIGLQEVKENINQFVAVMKFNALQIQNGVIPLHQSYHMIFSGNPGTGKTTVARIMGKILKDLNVLESGHVVEVDRSELVAGYSGQTAIKTKEVLRRALDGILFIDEAYALVADDKDAYGLESLQVILKFMEDYRDRIVIIAAGYPQDMENFLDANSGLRSRFQNQMVFHDYTASELIQIFNMYLSQQKLSIPTGFISQIEKHFEEMLQTPSKDFANARSVRNILDQIIRQHALNMNTPDFSPAVILYHDLKGVIKSIQDVPHSLIDLSGDPKSDPLPGTSIIHKKVQGKLNADFTNYILDCPSCQTTLEIPLQHIGAKIRCYHCDQKLILNDDFSISIFGKDA